MGDQGGAAGRGAQVSGDLTVAPGQTLYVEVGGAPTGGGNCFPGTACIGGFNGGGSSVVFGGGGGGASDVRTIARNQASRLSLESRLIVAAGGGGSGVGVICGALGDQLLQGGRGGDAGSDGGDGAKCEGFPGGTGGKAGTQSAGGAGGSPDGQSGSLGLGGAGRSGAGGNRAGGAGGGGYYGGGGGGTSLFSPPSVLAPAGEGAAAPTWCHKAAARP